MSSANWSLLAKMPKQQQQQQQQQQQKQNERKLGLNDIPGKY